MPLVKYRIYELSARAVISYSREQDGTYTFHLSAAETERCKSLSVPHEQDENALFYQIMCVLRGDAFTGTPGGQLVTDLSDIIFYMDFSGIFDRSGAKKKHLIRQEKAKALFRPEGVSLDFGSDPHRYLAFERSGSMSRQARLSFIREDFYDAVRRRIMMDMTIGDCQLSKLYAYNGLMLSSGIRIDGIDIDRPHRVVVVDNPVRTPPPTEVITVEDDGTQNSTRKYHRVETMADVEVICFDGEGLISKQYARLVDEKLCGKKIHTSFQIRMPYVKGMLHEVDFKDYLERSGANSITDLWGVQHPIQKVDIILTKSMFKGCGWLNGSGMSWEDYWAVFRKYRHALYITNVSKEKPEKTTELNYQFLNTVSLKADEFRPADLPDGWDHSPETDERNWLTKQTELAYYNFCANESFRQNYFLEKFERVSWWERHQGKDQLLATVLKNNPRFINEPVYAGGGRQRLSSRGSSGLPVGPAFNQNHTNQNTTRLYRFSLDARVGPRELLCSGCGLPIRSCLHTAAQSAYCPERRDAALSSRRAGTSIRSISQPSDGCCYGRLHFTRRRAFGRCRLRRRHDQDNQRSHFERMRETKHPSRFSAAAEHIFPVAQPAAADDPHGPATDPQCRRLGGPVRNRPQLLLLPRRPDL